MAYLKTSNFNSISRIFGMVQVLCFNCLFKCLKLFINCTWFVFAFGLEKGVDTHSDSFTRSRRPIFTILSTSFTHTASCTLGTGYVHDHTGFTSLFNYKFTGLVFQVPRIPSNSSSRFLRRVRSILRSSDSSCWHYSVITLFRSFFFYFECNILLIYRVALTVICDLKHSLT